MIRCVATYLQDMPNASESPRRTATIEGETKGDILLKARHGKPSGYYISTITDLSNHLVVWEFWKSWVREPQHYTG